MNKVCLRGLAAMTHPCREARTKQNGPKPCRTDVIRVRFPAWAFYTNMKIEKVWCSVIFEGF